MVQYQSFPDAAGDSRTLDKLMALRLPSLEGRSFLDVGCNEGFFCGFARFAGAARSIGIDRSSEFIYRAQARFPDCEFYVRDWEQLPEGIFDVILLASALHYADDQPTLIRRLVEKLAPGGVLILELGIASSPKAEWVKVKRGIDERYFPTMTQLKQTLVDYAWKWMGRSVDQAGDPVSRHVIHISHRRPVAYLLMQPPAYGKSSVASRLFPGAHVPVVSGDEVLHRIATSELKVSRRLQQIAGKEYSPFAIDKTIQRVFDSKLGEELISTWITAAGGGDFALDGFVPVEHHAYVERKLAEAGYMPVTLRWERVAPAQIPLDSMDRQAAAFERSLTAMESAHGFGGKSVSRQVVAGYVDEVRVEDGCVIVRGWALDQDRHAPTQLVIGIGAERTFVDVGEAQERNDVRRRLQLSHARVGYMIKVAVPTVSVPADLGSLGFSVTLTSGHPLRMSKAVIASINGASAKAEKKPLTFKD